jgi:hypothetical protein
MKLNKKEFKNLLLIGLISSFILGLFLKGFSPAIKFSLAFTLLFYLPLIPWIMQIEKIKLFQKSIFTALLGLSLIPIGYAIIGFFTPLNTMYFILIPLIVFLAGFHFLNKGNTFLNKE